jgi:chromosomal replication initiation ATPase DnaA
MEELEEFKEILISKMPEFGPVIDLIYKNILSKRHKRTVVRLSEFIKMMNSIMDYYGFIDSAIICNKTQEDYVVKYRQIYHYFALKYTNASQSAIGLLIGKKDHSTIHHSNVQVKNLMQSDRFFKEEVLFIEKELLNKMRM